MDQTYLTSITINKVRHLQNITIPLSPVSRKHLIFTGKMVAEKQVYWIRYPNISHTL